VVLLPVSLISGFTTEQLSAILAHELAHIRRHDFVVNILQRCVESILFYHPAVWWFPKGFAPNANIAATTLRFDSAAAGRSMPEALIELERARQPRRSWQSQRRTELSCSVSGAFSG
jgi:D-alanyl-D-alanine endopeptidase (penicillin-binding protein 7)